MSEFFYTLFIFPIESILNLIYLFLSRTLNNEGISILGMSISVTLLSLPLYDMAERWQNVERSTQERFKKKLTDIKSVFKGDEQHLVIRTFYRQNNYKPIYALRSVLGLAIQIPFFIAAYHYLSHLDALSEQSLYFIKDLAKPDGLLTISGISINILPILMTAINLLSTMVYSKKLTLREQIQLLVMALIFLILLYTSPSGLVIYWTLNNLFSLVKNIIYKTKNPLKTFKIVLLCVLVPICIWSISLHFSQALNAKRRLALNLASFGAVAFILILPYIGRVFDKIYNYFETLHTTNKMNVIFYLSCVVLFAMTGLVIPSALIHSSPQEFANAINSGKIADFANPAGMLWTTTMQAASFFMFYSMAIYSLFNKKVKFSMMWIYLIGMISALLNVFVFSGKYGNISPELQFDMPEKLQASLPASLLNIAVIVALIIVVAILIKRNLHKILTSVMMIIVIAFVPMIIKNTADINKSFAQYQILKSNGALETNSSTDKIEPFFKLSKTKKNVVVIMLDRAINSYFPLVLEYLPELKEHYKDFVYYPNTASFGGFTIFGVPTLFGGYEYTPLEMNARDTVPLVDKHNEALLVMPKIFQNAGYNTTFADPTYAGYNWTPDTSVLQREGVRSTSLNQKYTLEWTKKHIDVLPKSFVVPIRQNLIYFSLFREVPLPLRKIFYDKGNYCFTTTNKTDQKIKSLPSDLLGNYAELEFLPELCEYDSDKDEFIAFTNDITHEVFMYYPPDFIPLVAGNIDMNNGFTLPFSDTQALEHFTSNVVAFKLLTRWLDKLKTENVYNNTKIIIVSDHGNAISNNCFSDLGDKSKFVASFNPLLIVKDFNISKETLTTSNEFMTNADVPAIATSHLAPNIKNPFSGKPLKNDAYKKDGISIVANYLWQISSHGKYKFTYKDSEIIHVKDNMFDKKNWTIK